MRAKLILFAFSIIITATSCDISTILGLLDDEKSSKYVLLFDGKDDIVTVPQVDLKLDSLSREITIEAWININDFTGEYPRIVDRSDNISNDRFLIGINAWEHRAHVNLNGYSIDSDEILLPDKWYHIAATYDGLELKLYLDGELQNILPVFTKLNVNESKLFIGNNELLNRPFNGKISRVAIWNIERSSTQINNDYKRGIAPFSTGIIKYWRFNSGKGQVVKDIISGDSAYLGFDDSVEENDPSWVLR